MKGIKIYQEHILHPNAATVLGILWLGTEQSLELKCGSEVTLAALARVTSKAAECGYFASDVNFHQDEEHLIRWLRSTLVSAFNTGIIYVLEPGERVGFLGDCYLTLPAGIFGYLNLTGILKLWDDEFKTHTGERE